MIGGVLVWIGVSAIFVFIAFWYDATFGDGDGNSGVVWLFMFIGMFWPFLLAFFWNIKTTFFPSSKDIEDKRREQRIEQHYRITEIKNKIQQQFDKGNYSSAFQQLQQFLMQENDAESYLNLGYMYENGYGTTKDYGKAMQCYQKANAWREIGYMHYFGYGVPKNKDKANEYFAKCDDRKDCEEVIKCFEAITNYNKNASAYYNLGYYYDEGKGISQDYQKALYYYKKAADLGNSSACNNLGCMYDSGKGVARDYSLAVRYFQKGADLGNATACNNVGSCYENGEGGLLGAKPDKYKALKYYKKACNLGDKKGCENFRRLKNEMGIRNDDDVLF